jgi:hypothetical protein
MKTDIAYAALPTGHECGERNGKTLIHSDDPAATTCGTYGCKKHSWVEWNPLHDDGDSRRLERACVKWLCGNIYGSDIRALEDACRVVRAIGTDAEDNAAVFALAVAIGKTMEGNDNAG